jgi:GNAT superfamily N-acetyltransferase
LADLKIEEPGPGDWPAIVRICSEVLGEGYIDLLDRDALRFYVARYRKEGIAGFAAIEVYRAGQLTKVFPQVETHTLPFALQECDRLGLVRSFKTLAIDPRFQRRGIGTSLFRFAEAKCMDARENGVVVPAWKQGDTINGKRILETHGYCSICTISDHWKEGCEKGVFQCPAKEPQRSCVCSLSLYWKLLVKG